MDQNAGSEERRIEYEKSAHVNHGEAALVLPWRRVSAELTANSSAGTLNVEFFSAMEDDPDSEVAVASRHARA